MTNVTNSTPETKQLCELSPTELSQYRRATILNEVEMIVKCLGTNNVLKNLKVALSEIIYNDCLCSDEFKEVYGVIEYHIDFYLKLLQLDDLSNNVNPSIFKKMGNDIDHELQAMRDIKTYQYGRTLNNIHNEVQ